jgi:hypothetical protein
MNGENPAATPPPGEEQLPPGEQRVRPDEGRAPAGDERVDAAVTELDALADLPVEDHPVVLERVHGRLAEILVGLDEEQR